MKSPIPWMGGKRRLADQIFKRMPEHTCYVEPFAGGASILFLREEPAKAEVLNDIDGELVNFFRVVKHHMVEFCNQFRWALVSRKIFEWEKITPPEVLTDIQRAARFYYLQYTRFGASPTGGFGVATTKGPNLNLARIEESITQTHLRLSQVFIEHLDWHECIKKYDRSHTFFFLDPPYWKLSGCGGKFGLEDYKRIAGAMTDMKGKAMLTINDHKDMRAIFRGFKFSRASIRYTTGGSHRSNKKSTELIYRNW